jgi:predicted N-acetyltransferase YhbS
MEIKIRQENPADYEQVFHLTELAFAEMEFADHDEQFLVEKLRKSEFFIPELSLVAEVGDKIIGHILLTRLKIQGNGAEYESLSLAPVSVLPAFQKQGVGGMLIRKAHQIATDLGYKSVILVGHPEYYPRFGYKKASEYGITFPFKVPEDACMAIELAENGLEGITGMVIYSPEYNLPSQ